MVFKVEKNISEKDNEATLRIRWREYSNITISPYSDRLYIEQLYDWAKGIKLIADQIEKSKIDLLDELYADGYIENDIYQLKKTNLKNG